MSRYCKTLNPCVGAIEGDRFKSWLEPYHVTGFPSLLFFEKGEFQFKYNGPREKDAIVKFMLDPNPAFSEDAKNEESEKDEILMGLPEEVTVLNHKNFEEFQLVDILKDDNILK